jgi:lysophospholipase L1-like esterase
MTNDVPRTVRKMIGLPIACAAAIVCLVWPLDLGAQGKTAPRWVGTWATAPAWRTAIQAGQPAAGAAATPSGLPGPVVPIEITNQTLRQIVHTSLAGDRVRVVFSNEFGTSPLAIGGAHVGRRAKGAAIVAGSGRPLTFAGQPAATIPAGAALISDDVELSVQAGADLAVDLYVPGTTEGSTSPITWHQRAYQTNYVSRTGNHAGAADFPVAATTLIWHYLTRVEVSAHPDAFAVVTIGDSITDGYGSDVDTNTRWPDELARRLRANARTRHASVLNLGIGGNRLLAEAGGGFGVSALARFDRDVLAQPNLRYIIVLEGINDIGFGKPGAGPTAAELILARRQLITRAHAHGITIFGGTLTPFDGANYWTPQGEATRKAVNEWMRTSGAYDGVIDFDRAVHDPGQPTKFLPQLHPGDFLHLNSAGYKAMAAAVDVKLFEKGTR